MSKDMSNNSTNQREAIVYCPIVGSKQLVIYGCVYQIHPSYDLYAASRDGQIIHVIKQAVMAVNIVLVIYIARWENMGTKFKKDIL